MGFTALPENATFCDARAGTIVVAGAYEANVADAWDEVGVDAALCDSGGTNNPPMADFTYNVSGLTVDFTDQSTDSDGNVVEWLWDFGDGNTSTAQHPSHSYAAGDTYTVTLTVTDDDGATNSTSQNVTVSEPAGGVAVDSISPNQIQAGDTAGVTISGSGFVSGAEVTFENGNGPAPAASVTDVTSTSITATVTASSGGPPSDRVWDVRVTNLDGSSGVLQGGFTVTP